MHNKAKPQISFYSEKKKEKRKKERAGKKKGTIQYETNKQTKEYIYIYKHCIYIKETNAAKEDIN